jgi:hypothetical protein
MSELCVRCGYPGGDHSRKDCEIFELRDTVSRLRAEKIKVAEAWMEQKDRADAAEAEVAKCHNSLSFTVAELERVRCVNEELRLRLIDGEALSAELAEAKEREIAHTKAVGESASVLLRERDGAALRAESLYECAASLQGEVDILMGVAVDSWKLLAEWRPVGWVDHACCECIPHGEILIDGFQCVYHKVKRIAAAWVGEQA